MATVRIIIFIFMTIFYWDLYTINSINYVERRSVCRGLFLGDSDIVLRILLSYHHSRTSAVGE